MARTSRSIKNASTTAVVVTTNARKRKSTGDIEDSNTKLAKQPRKSLDAYFSREVLASGLPDDNDDSTRKHVALNEQQIAVMKMVVEEEKNVFFTGSAGKPCLEFYSPSDADPYHRDGEVLATACHRCSSTEEV